MTTRIYTESDLRAQIAATCDLSPRTYNPIGYTDRHEAVCKYVGEFGNSCIVGTLVRVFHGVTVDQLRPFENTGAFRLIEGLELPVSGQSGTEMVELQLAADGPKPKAGPATPTPWGEIPKLIGLKDNDYTPEQYAEARQALLDWIRPYVEARAAERDARAASEVSDPEGVGGC